MVNLAVLFRYAINLCIPKATFCTLAQMCKPCLRIHWVTLGPFEKGIDPNAQGHEILDAQICSIKMEKTQVI